MVSSATHKDSFHPTLMNDTSEQDSSRPSSENCVFQCIDLDAGGEALWSRVPQVAQGHDCLVISGCDLCSRMRFLCFIVL